MSYSVDYADTETGSLLSHLWGPCRHHQLQCGGSGLVPMALGRTGSEWWTSLWDQPRERRGGIAKRDEDKLSKQVKGNVMLISPHNVMWFERSPGQDLCSWVHPDFQSPEHDGWAALNTWEVTKRARDQTEWMCLGFKLPSVLLFLLRTTWHPHSQTQLLGVCL